MNTRGTSDHTADLPPLMDLDKAVRYLLGAYARRHAQESGVERQAALHRSGERMRFVPS